MDITIYVQDQTGEKRELVAPTDMALNLMEFLKGNEYPIEAICGGMALCATCHIEVLEGEFGQRTDAEVDMLDTLFNTTDRSRLACQMRLNEKMDGIVVRLKGEND